ncbi:hypothetical protein RFI_19042 [Reticulomyxa filosa]|uniref:Thioredoxin domain-containing protein n=1 Tax=Reticulomyxa filosa TaxID=46433 RepID=X6MXM3_RETFI|nr:hypothetical protein RFI_19042 [Reticulomyxa filosa]|eukprot:ETO18237.1 hypothetical protein RFI_19042 [Reticulomyxa filosa]
MAFLAHKTDAESSGKKRIVVVNGMDELNSRLEESSKKYARVWVLFCGTIDEKTGGSWCPDCVEADPVINKCLSKLSDKEWDKSIFIKCYVGDRPFWKDPNCIFRKDKRFSLKAVPTLIEWNTPKKLIDAECKKEVMVSALLEDTE